MAEIETPRQSESINSGYEEINKYFGGSTLEELSHTQNNQIKNTLDKVINSGEKAKLITLFDDESPINSIVLLENILLKAGYLPVTQTLAEKTGNKQRELELQYKSESEKISDLARGNLGKDEQMKEKISEDLVSSDLVRDLVSSDLSGNYDKVRLQIDTALDCLDNDQKEQLKQATSKKEDSLHAVNDKGDVEYNGKIMGRDNAILQIRADYIVSNSENLLGGISNLNQKKRFSESVDLLKSMGFGNEYIKDKQGLLNSISNDPAVPKDVRTRNTEAVSTILKDSNKAEGYRFNDGSMLIKYEDKDGQSREMIVTGYGVLKKRREGLSIETNLMESAKKVDQVPREKVEKGAQESHEKKGAFIGGIEEFFSGELSKEMKDNQKDTKGGDERGLMTIEYSRVLLSELSMPVDLHDGKSIEKKLEQLNNIRNIGEAAMPSWPTDMGDRSTPGADIQKIRESLMMRIESPLEQYKKSLAAQLQNIKKLNIVQKSNPFQESIKNFDSIAESNLSFLIDLGYDKLGQSTLEKVNTALNREYQGIGGNDYIDLSREPLDRQQKQRILLALTRIMHTSGQGLMPEWDKVNNDDPAIGYGQTRSPLWSTQLQELGKKNTYRQLIQSPSMDNFQNIITGRKSAEVRSEGT